MKHPWFVIHRQQDVERMPLVEDLKKVIPDIHIFSGLDGSQFQFMPRLHPEEYKPVSLPVMGCAMSHLTILRKCYKLGLEQVGIFEDDAVLKGDVSGCLEMDMKCDIYYLGLSNMLKGTISFDPEDRYTTDNGMILYTQFNVKRSYGAFGYIVNRKAMEAILNTFTNCLSEGFFYPYDHLLNKAIQDYGLKAKTPMKPLVDFKRGLFSSLSNRIRY